MEKTQNPGGDPLEAVKAKFGLEEINSMLYNKGWQLNFIQQNLHGSVLKAVAENRIVSLVNTLDIGIRLQESLITTNLTKDDQEYLLMLRDSYEEIPDTDTSHLLQALFDRYDFIIRRIDTTMSEKTWYAEEGEDGGILSTLISDRIAGHNQNFIFGFHGLPRSGKSRGAGRIGVNVNFLVEKILKTKVGFSEKDWVYSKEEYLRRLKERKNEGTLKGSFLILEEAGDMLNSQRFWDKDVVGAVDILRQQGYQNTCLCIISQLHRDVVNKARGLMHAVAVPWKDLYKRSIELEDIGNIDFQRNMSYWKIDILDIDPMTGKAYPQGIRVALGRVKKLGVLMPPKKIDDAYDKKDIEHKDQKQEKQMSDTIKENLQIGNEDTLVRCAQEILADIDRYRLPSGKWKTGKIGNKFKVGGRLAVKIRDKAEDLMEKGPLKKTPKTIKRSVKAPPKTETPPPEQPQPTLQPAAEEKPAEPKPPEPPAEAESPKPSMSLDEIDVTLARWKKEREEREAKRQEEQNATTEQK
jgi:hypothetical protein